MVFLKFIALLLILYGAMCFVARDALWRLSVPEYARERVNRATWDRMSMITGAVAIVIGVALFAVTLGESAPPGSSTSLCSPGKTLGPGDVIAGPVGAYGWTPRSGGTPSNSG